LYFFFYGKNPLSLSQIFKLQREFFFKHNLFKLKEEFLKPKLVKLITNQSFFIRSYVEMKNLGPIDLQVDM